MTTSGKKFLEEQEQDTVKILSNSPDQTIRASRLAEIQKLQNPPQGTISAVTPEQQRSLKIGSLKKSISDRLAYPKKLLSNGLESAKGILKMSEQAIGEAYTEGMHKFVYRNTRNIDEDRSQNYEQVKKDEKEIKSFAKPILEKNDETQGLIEEAKTGKTNIFSFAYKNSAEYGAGSSINTIFPNQWVDVNENTVYFANSKTTVSKPVLKNSLKFGTSKLLDVYNSITYNFQHNGDVYSVEDIKTYVPEWQDVPDGVIQQFIYDALSDVQTGERRDIDLYAEYYPALSNGDKYVNQKDALLQLLTDENFRNRGLADYLEIPTEDGETIAPQKLINGKIGGQDLMNLLDAAMTIKAGATILNEGGANITQATDYAIAKSYADQYPLVKEALKLFDSRDLSIEDFDKLVENYNANIGSINHEYQSYGGDNEMTLAQLEAKVDEILWRNMRRDNDAFLNSWNKERLQGKYWYAGEGKIDSYILGLADAYRADDGKWYDKDGNEVEATETRRGITGKYLNLLVDAGETMSTLGHEWDILDEDPTRESVVNVISDNVNLYFDLWNFTKGGFKFNLKTQIPFVGPIYEKLIGGVNEVSGELILGLANMTLFADGAWSEESQQKFKQAAGGLVSIQVLGAIERAKGHLKAELKKDYYQSAFKKALDSYTTELTKGLLVIDIEAEKAKITKQNQPEQAEGENQKEVDKIEKDRKVQRIVFMRGVLDRALNSFNKTFEEELQKNAGEGYKPSIIDYLWNLAGRLANRKEGKTTDEILDEGIKKIDEQRAENEKQIEELEKRKNELESKERTEEENKELDSLNEKIAELRKMTDELTSKRDTTEETQSEEYREIKAELDKKRTDLETTKQQREELKSQLDDINNQIINARGEGNTELVKELTEQKKDTKKQIEDIDKEIKNLERDIRTLEGNGTIRDMLEDIKQGAREAYQETKDAFKREKTDQEITTPETPEVKVEETKTGTPEIAEGVAETETKAPEETKTTVAKILDIIQKLQDNARGLYDKLTKPSEDKKIRQREIERLEREDELLNRMGDEGKLDKSILDKLENNPFTDEIMRIVDRQTDVETDTKGRPKNVTPKTDEKLERDLSKDDVEREVLSSGLERMQQYVDNIKSLLKKIGEVYDKLSKEKNIDSMEFIEGDILRNLLDKYNLKIEIEENEKGEQKAKVSKKDNVDTTAVEEGIVKYVEDFINKTLKFEMKSEADVQADRTKLTWNEDTYGKYDDGFENEFRKAFNDFLDTKADQTELLRKLDEQFSNLKENLEIFDEFMNKKGEMKNSAKNKILKLRKEDLAQLEQILPGITKLVELTKISYDLVSKVKKAKMQYKDSNLLRGHWVRYMSVMAASNVAGYIAAGWLGIPLASLAFVALERGGTAAKRKMSPKELDRSTYSKYVDLLKVDGNEKAEYKQGELERLKKESEILKGKKEAEVQQTLNDAMEILIKRKANELIQQKAREEERERRVREREDRERKEAWDKSLQPIDNALPGVKPDVVTPEGDITLGRGNPISPAPTKTNRAKPITEVKETYKDKEKTQKGYSEAENKIIETALGLEEKEYSKDSEELANVIEESVDATSRIMKKNAVNRLEEKGEDVTKENIAKEAAKEPSTIEEFLAEMNENSNTDKEDPTKPDYRKTDLDTLLEIAEHPDKYPDVDIEEVNEAIEYITQKNARAEMREGGGMRGSDINMEYTFAAEVDRVNGMEQRMADAKTPETKEKLKKEWIKAKEDVIEEIQQAYNIDQFEASDKFDQLSNASLKTIEEGNKTKNGYKGKHRVSKAEQDKLLALMGKGPSQNITYTSTAENIATLENPASKKRVAEQRIEKVVDPKLEKAKIGINKDKIARNTAKWQAEKEALENIIAEANKELEAQQEIKNQKKELAQDYKDLDAKRAATPYKETKKEITKKMDKISDEFDKLTEKEFADTYSKPKEVEEAEAKEQGEMQEFDKDMDENETPQKSENEIDDTEGISILYTNEAYESGMPEAEIWRNNEKIGERNPFSGITGKLSDTQKQYAVKKINNRSKTTPDNKKAPKTVKELKEKGFTDEEIEKLQNLNIASDPLNEYLKNSTKVPEAYKAMNRELADVQAEFVDTMRALSKLDNYEGELRRGGNGKEFGENIKEGDTIENKQLLFSSDVKIEDSAYKDSPVYYKINAKGKGTKDSVIEGGKERDFVTMPGQKFKVEKITKEGDKTIYEITEIDDTAEPTKKAEEKNVEPKKETPKTEEKKVESKKEKGSEPLVKIESDMSIYKEPIVGDYKTQEIFDRMEYIKKQAKEKGKLYAKEATELKFLQDLYKRQVEWEGREKQGDITDEDYVKAYETGGGGINKAPF